MNIERELEICERTTQEEWWLLHQPTKPGFPESYHVLIGDQDDRICELENLADGKVAHNGVFIVQAHANYPTALRMLQAIEARCQQASHAGMNTETHRLAADVLGILKQSQRSQHNER